MDGKEVFKIIREQEEKGHVVFSTFEGLQGRKLDDMIAQPTDGLLYDLNRDKATCATFIQHEEGGGTWVNNYACALVIARLKEKLAEAESKVRN